MQVGIDHRGGRPAGSRQQAAGSRQQAARAAGAHHMPRKLHSLSQHCHSRAALLRVAGQSAHGLDGALQAHGLWVAARAAGLPGKCRRGRQAERKQQVESRLAGSSEQSALHKTCAALSAAPPTHSPSELGPSCKQASQPAGPHVYGHNLYGHKRSKGLGVHVILAAVGVDGARLCEVREQLRAGRWQAGAEVGCLGACAGVAWAQRGSTIRRYGCGMPRHRHGATSAAQHRAAQRTRRMM